MLRQIMRPTMGLLIAYPQCSLRSACMLRVCVCFKRQASCRPSGSCISKRHADINGTWVYDLKYKATAFKGLMMSWSGLRSLNTMGLKHRHFSPCSKACWFERSWGLHFELMTCLPAVPRVASHMGSPLLFITRL